MPQNPMPKIDKISTITDSLLQRNHIPARLRGYTYLRSAIIAAAQSPGAPLKMLYHDIARTQHTTPAAVDHGIRYAIRAGGHYTITAKEMIYSTAMTVAQVAAQMM